MLNGAQEQFIAPLHLPLHLSFPLHAPTNFLPFDPYNQLPLQTPTVLHRDEEKVSSINFEINETYETQLPDEWTNDQVLALLSIRSTMDSCFPDLTWDHVSRKLAEIGFNKSAEKCKDKFEAESKNYGFVSEVGEFYQGDTITTKVNKQLEKPRGHTLEEDSTNIDPPCEKSKEIRKRKRRERFETFKGFCESIVSKTMAKQEEIHKKILQDMLKREEDNVAREEAWKKQEMDRMNKELDIMAQEQAVAGHRHATIIEFLNKYLTPTSLLHSQHPINPSTQNPSPGDTIQVPSSSNSSTAPPHKPSSSFSSHNNEKLEGVGSRWPRDQVLALINLKCTSVNDDRAPLWERISQGMLQLGYKRSAKRCKEKWENINKYFRKTKHVNKKRSLDSRTCPYFHQLRSLYSEGKLVPQSLKARKIASV